MTQPISSNPSPQDYLLVPAYPLPNGTLHLGHMAGPYLNLDMLARHLRRRGDRVQVISGSDPYEPYLTIRAEKDGRDPVELANEYHDRIVGDYEALDIGMDTFINPLSPEWAPRYDATYEEMARRILAHGASEWIEETMCYSPARSQFVVGCWLLGKCPVCGTDGGGFSCEDCGAYFRRLREPRSRRGEPLVERRVENLFFRIPDTAALLRQLAATETPEQYRQICVRHLEIEGPLLPLTVPDSWGLPWTGSDDGQRRALVGIGFAFAYGYLCGEVYRELTGCRLNPFDQGSSVVTVKAFGVDCLVPNLVGLQAMALNLEGFRPFDRFVINHFYLLEGEKFSTGRRHAIWAGELIEKTPVASDAVRYYLALTNPIEQRQNFDVHQFLEVLNERFGEPLNRLLTGAFSKLEGRAPRPLGDSFARRLRAALEEQEDAFAFRSFEPQRVVSSIDGWLSEPGEESDSAYWWLTGFALLAEPVMPGVAGEVWRALGKEGSPSCAAALSPARPLPEPGLTPFAAIALGDIAHCLPSTVSLPSTSNAEVPADVPAGA